MRDLEIRGAGDVLGVNQHGTIRVVGVNLFLRMLNKTVEEMKSGKYAGGGPTEKEETVSIEIPLAAYIPNKYIPDTKDKINVYQKLSSVDDLELLNELREDLLTEYGKFPRQVNNLFKVLLFKTRRTLFLRVLFIFKKIPLRALFVILRAFH